MVCLHIIFILIYYLNTKESFSFSILLPRSLAPDVLAGVKSVGWYLIRYVQLQPWFLILFLILDPSSMANISLFSFSTLMFYLLPPLNDNYFFSSS